MIILIFLVSEMPFAGLRVVYLIVSALMTVPILFNVYSQNNAQIIQIQDSPQVRNIVDVIYDDTGSNESISVEHSKEKNLNVFSGIFTKVLYQKGFTQKQADICPEKGKGKKLMIIVTSAPDHEQARNDVRNTWGKSLSKNISFGFLLGFTPNVTVNNKIKNEQKIHGDIIQGNSFDSYDNLTLKTISALEWIDTYCSEADFVLKTDDDVFINIDRLLAFLRDVDTKTDAIYGRLAKNWKPLRNKKSKYYTSVQQYKPELFPTFTTGPAYVFPARLSHKLFESALNKNYFKLEDVYTTGLVAESLGITRKNIVGFLNKRIYFTPCNLKKHISLHPLRKGEHMKLWKMFNEKDNCEKYRI